MTTEVKAPERYVKLPSTSILFLAGSINMGRTPKWRNKITEELKNIDNFLILNPRRDDWDNTLENTMINKKFREQVEWELKGMISSDVIAMYLAPDELSPISLLELGLFHKKMLVYCSEKYPRKGNIDITCKMLEIKQVNSFKEMIEQIRRDMEF